MFFFLFLSLRVYILMIITVMRCAFVFFFGGVETYEPQFKWMAAVVGVILEQSKNIGSMRKWGETIIRASFCSWEHVPIFSRPFEYWILISLNKWLIMENITHRVKNPMIHMKHIQIFLAASHLYTASHTHWTHPLTSDIPGSHCHWTAGTKCGECVQTIQSVMWNTSDVLFWFSSIDDEYQSKWWVRNNNFFSELINNHPIGIYGKMQSIDDLRYINMLMLKFSDDFLTFLDKSWIECNAILCVSLPVVLNLTMQIQITLTNFCILFSRWTYQNNVALFARSANATNCTRWHNTKSRRNVKLLRADVVTIANSKVLVAKLNPSSERR